MNKGLISVIIPVYNVEEYIRECLDSLVNQTYKNLEIILIDDESPDNCGTICDEYATNDARIKVIHQKNAGAAAARNAGLRMATGEYLAFVDSDDYIELDAYEYMINKLNEENADVIQCNHYDLYVDKLVERNIIEKNHEYTQIEYLGRFLNDWTCCLLWDKLFKSELFDNVFFEEGNVIDDEFFTYQGIMNAKKIVCDTKLVYYYRKRKSGAMYSPEHCQRIILDRLNYLEKRRNNVIKRYSELKKSYNNNFIESLCYYAKDYGAAEESIEKTKSLLKEYYPNCRSDLNRALKFTVLKLKMQSVDKILLQKNQMSIVVDTSNYFE